MPIARASSLAATLAVIDVVSHAAASVVVLGRWHDAPRGARLDDVVDVHQLGPGLGEVLPRVGRCVERGERPARPVVGAGVVGVERRRRSRPARRRTARGTRPAGSVSEATSVSQTKWPSSWRMWPSGVR